MKPLYQQALTAQDLDQPGEFFFPADHRVQPPRLGLSTIEPGHRRYREARLRGFGYLGRPRWMLT